jgi:SnoaL-like domain
MPNPIDVQEALDILEITRVLYTCFRATDAKHWDEFEATLADEVAIDLAQCSRPRP